ncbi:bifunctional methyltransferase/pyrophosphohydrolase YabN [Pontibacillus litoralis]|uniref:MazG family protein n=1 Tax=Pontibacillus litoralis JSM 072002 TaxID=1385512 RepID=A0A0A5G345_9BACI|nr:nucleoside triphosphate pyrophosphohydrolase [Pontibacillus litoralis]KGX85485.1 hypothetical protein N784_09020 [Pontibacillus litoralis JSM 072002]
MKQITVIGLGAGDLEQLSVGLYRTLIAYKGEVYVRTMDHPVVKALQEEGVCFTGFDHIYESYDQFEEVYDSIVSTLLEKANHNEVMYAVPGHPMLAERTVQLLLQAQKRGDVKVNMQGGHSYLDALFTALHIDPIEGFQFLDATSFARRDIHYGQHTIFCQVYDEMIASTVKIELMEDLPYDYPVYIVTAAGSEQENIQQVPLYELDREVMVNNLTSVYVPPAPSELLQHQFRRLYEVIATLRGPNGCPWDKEQTHESLRPYLLEEAYELIQAIHDQDDEGMIEELGDVLLQVMLHSQIGADEGFFTIDDVIASITDKMIRRHPHVFGDEKMHTSEEVVGTWEAIKQIEKGSERPSAIDGVAEVLSGLLKAEQLQKKARKVGFDWDDPKPIWDKVQEEIYEFHESVQTLSHDEQEGELGDILFALVNIARYYKINPELALQRTNHKFERRFREMEKEIQQAGFTMKNLSLDELDHYWEQAKQKERSDS